MRYKKYLLKTTTKYISSKGGGKLCHKMLNPDAVPKVNNFISRVIYYMRYKKHLLKTTTKYISSKGGEKLCHKILNLRFSYL